VGFVVSKRGTFGVEERRYRNEDGVAIVLIRWGRWGWLTPVLAKDVVRLHSRYESEARAEARDLLETGVS
jgi:hypothetical protein